MSSGRPPSTFTVRPFADIGTSELFVTRITLGLPDVVGATVFNNQKEIKDAIVNLSMDCLMPAFTALRELRKIAADDNIPVLTKIKNFDDMCRYLWTAYKDRMKSVGKLLGS